MTDPRLAIYPNPLLKKKAKRIQKISSEIIKLVPQMKTTMRKNDGVGLAAPQIGISQQLILVQGPNEIRIFLNPKIIRLGRKKIVEEEGCLSLPGVLLKLKRSNEIEVECQTLKGEHV